jgi:hypothetical protein
LRRGDEAQQARQAARANAREAANEQAHAPATDSEEEAGAAPDVGPRALSRKKVQAVTKNWAVGDEVFVHWARAADPEDPTTVHVARWFGKVTVAGYRATVAFDGAICDRCSEKRAMTPVEIHVPWAGTTYYAVESRRAPPTSDCTCEDVDDSSDEDGEHADAEQADIPGAIDHEDRLVVNSPEGSEPRGVILPQSDTVRRGDVGHRWHVYETKPPGVHDLVWNGYAQSTRDEHRRWIQRVRGMPTELRTQPLGKALVELTRRMAVQRRWVWSTLASALATLATALKNLSLYTTEQQGINVKEDPYFSEALKTAQRKAKTTVGSTDISTGMTEEVYRTLISSEGIKSPHPRLLLMLSWHFAARVGDMRQVRSRDIVADAVQPDGRVAMRTTFRYGKVASLWGPYTIHAVVPKDVASALTALKAVRGNNERGGELFTKRDQAALAAHIAAATPVGSTGRLNLRSVRRGALLRAAASGATDDELQLLSGHRRRDTLMRYLGWGQMSSTMSNAAQSRADKALRPAGSGTDYIPSQLQAPVMGLYSGYTGTKGRRVSKRPEFFPRKPPSAHDCGITVSQAELATYQLHIKETSRVKWDEVERLAEGSPLAQQLVRAKQWCNTDELYGPRYGRDPKHVPAASFTAEQIKRMLQANKIRPFRGEVKGFVKAFTLPQHAKKRLRIIAEPAINETCQRHLMYEVHYPSRLERRARARGAKFSVELDFAAYFDQFDLARDVQDWFVFRSKEPVDGHEMFALTRLPMGATFAPSVAQTVTSIIVWPLISMQGVRVDTMIDNIRIVADNKEAFVKAVRTVAARISLAGITLNDPHLIQGSDDQLAERHAVTATPRVFLGEKYVRDTVANSDAAIDKLKNAKAVFDNIGRPGAPTYTKRQFASLVGLMLFMAHTVNLPLTRCFDLLRSYGTIISQTTSWDDACTVTSPAARATLEWMASTLIANKPVPLPVLTPPGATVQDYQIAIEVDASGSAWGARVLFTDSGRMVTLQQRWSTRVSHSAHAEPRAAALAVRWARSQPGYGNAKVALITDHGALATGQRRWYSSFSGFSTSYHLNNFFSTLYDNGGGEVFHVDGERNEADQLSRDPSAGYTLTVREGSTTFRELATVKHPFETIPRADYQV